MFQKEKRPAQGINKKWVVSRYRALPGKGFLDEVDIGHVHFGTHGSANVIAQGTTSTYCYAHSPHSSLDLPVKDSIDVG